MPKTKPSTWLAGKIALGLALLLAGAAACARPAAEPTSATRGAVTGLRPMGEILTLRMQRVTRGDVSRAGTVRPAPPSYVEWRVESEAVRALGPGHELEIVVEGDVATLEGTIPTGWQASDLERRLRGIDVLSGAKTAFVIVDPDAIRPREAASEDAGAAGNETP